MRFVSAWATPALLLAVPTALIAGGRDGLWLGLLFVVAPLFAALAAPEPAAAGSQQSLPPAVLLLVVGVIVWANLGLAGDVATWTGWPRWTGIVPAAIAAAGLSVTVVIPAGTDPPVSPWITNTRTWSVWEWITDAAQEVLYVPIIDRLNRLTFRPYASPLARARSLDSTEMIDLAVVTDYSGL